MKDSEREPMEQTLELQVDAKRWEQVREICRRLAGREVTDADCLTRSVSLALCSRTFDRNTWVKRKATWNGSYRCCGPWDRSSSLSTRPTLL